MMHIEQTVTVTAQSTFGRDGAMFEGLLGFVAQLSLGLWSLVIFTAVVRFVGMRIYRHAAARKPLLETETETETETTPSIAVPAAVTASVRDPLSSPRSRHVAPVSSASLSSATLSSASMSSAPLSAATVSNAPVSAARVAARASDSVEA